MSKRDYTEEDDRRLREEGIAGDIYLFKNNTEMSPRESALTEAKKLITGDRNNQYGPPTQDFNRTARMANAFGFAVVDEAGNVNPVQAHHVALFVMFVKLSRLAWTPQKRDSWVDIAGYAGCGFECAVTEEP